MLTTVILPPGVGNPGSVLHGLTPFPLDPLDPVENSRRLKKEQQSYSMVLAHLAGKWGPSLSLAWEKCASAAGNSKSPNLTKNGREMGRHPSVLRIPGGSDRLRSGPELVG